MKKLTIVLLALLLIGGMAFADITLTGEASLELGYDLDTGAYGFVNDTDTADVEFSFTLDSADASAMGDADVYAVIEMSGSIDVNIDGTDADDGIDNDGDTETDDIDGDYEIGDEIVTDVSIDTAKIVGEDWEVSILGMTDDFDYAESYQDYDDDDDNENDVSGDFSDGGGIAVTYGDYTLGLDYYSADTIVYGLYAATSMEVADGVTVDVAAGFDDASGFDAGAQVAYDMDGTTVTVAVDTENNFANIDAALATSLDMDGTTVALDAYYGADLYVQAVAELDAASVTLNGDLLLSTQVLGVEVAFDATDDLALTVDGGFTITTSAWDAGLEAVYSMDDWDVTLAGGYASTGAIDLSADIESTTLVDGATIAAGYAVDDITTELGAITTSVTIAL